MKTKPEVLKGGNGTSVLPVDGSERLPPPSQPGAQKSKIVFKPNSYCLPKRVIFQDIRDTTKHRE